MLYVALGAQLLLVAGAYALETRPSASGERSKLRIAVLWSLVWLVLGLLPTVWFGVFESAHAASSYAAVYTIERALSLDNVFVFAVLIAAFEIPGEEREQMVSYGAFAAFALRIPAIVLGVVAFNASHVVAYALGVLLLGLAWHTARSSESTPGPSRAVAYLQRRLPVSEHVPRRWLVMRDGHREVTPMLICLFAIMLADLAFALDSIPAALAISHDATLLLVGNLLALLGLRALFQLVLMARERLRYMDQTIAVLLLLVGLKLLAAELLTVGPLASLAIVIAVLAAGATLSLRGDGRRAPTSM